MDLEVQGYIDEFNTIRGDISKAIEGLNENGANWRPLSKDANSIFAILTHIMGANRNWINQVINGETIQRDRSAEFTASGNLTELLTRWEKAWKETESILRKLKHAQLSESRSLSHPINQKDSITVQGAIIHQLNHCAVHLGHIQLTRQLWDQYSKK